MKDTGSENCFCDPVCDFCVHYDFNGDENGCYTGDGRCKHSEHPGPMDPLDWCDDYCCRFCSGDTEVSRRGRKPLTPEDRDAMLREVLPSGSSLGAGREGPRA